MGRIAIWPILYKPIFEVMCQTHNSNNKCKQLNVGTLNVRGCKARYQKQIVANDALNYDLDILGLSGTHIKGEGLEEIRAFQKDKHRDYLMYYTGSDNNKHHGVGLLINKELDPSFTKISDRICVAKVVTKDAVFLPFQHMPLQSQQAKNILNKETNFMTSWIRQ